ERRVTDFLDHAAYGTAHVRALVFVRDEQRELQRAPDLHPGGSRQVTELHQGARLAEIFHFEDVIGVRASHAHLRQDLVARVTTPLRLCALAHLASTLGETAARPYYKAHLFEITRPSRRARA